VEWGGRDKTKPQPEKTAGGVKKAKAHLIEQLTIHNRPFTIDK
jgi:hypothetical protein